MKLVSTMLGSAVAIAGSAMTSDIFGQPLSEAALIHIEDEVEKAIGGKVDRNRSPLFNDLSKMINETMSPAILTAHTSAQTQLDGFRTAFEACTPPVVSDDGSGVTVTGQQISDKLEEHRQCRQSEQAARSGAEECDKKLTQGQTVKHAACDAVPGSDGTLPPLDQQGHVGCKVTPGDYEGWLNSFTSQVQSLKTQFDEAQGGCGNASQLVDDLTPKCVAANQSIGQNKTACDAIQAQADQMACSSDPIQASQCGAYNSCYDTAKKNYLDANESIAAAQVNRTAQWRVMKRMLCLLTEESAGASHEGIDACRNQTIDTSHLDLVYPDIPSKVDCTIDKVLEDHPLPCSGDWVKLYGELPATSPAAPCTPCPLCTDVEPAEGLIYRIRTAGGRLYQGEFLTMADGGFLAQGGFQGDRYRIYDPTVPGWQFTSAIKPGEWRVSSRPESVGAHGFKNPHVIESVDEPGRYLMSGPVPALQQSNMPWYSWFLCGTAEQLQASGITTDRDCSCGEKGVKALVDIRKDPDSMKTIIVNTATQFMAGMQPNGKGGVFSFNQANALYNKWFFEPVFDASKGYIIQSTIPTYQSPNYWSSNGLSTSNSPALGPVVKIGRTMINANNPSDKKFSQFKFLPPPAGFQATAAEKKRASQHLIQDAFSSRFVEQKSLTGGPELGVFWTSSEVTWNIQMTDLGTFDLEQAGMQGGRVTSWLRAGTPKIRGVNGNAGTPLYLTMASSPSSKSYSHWIIKEASCMPYGFKSKCATGDESISTADKGESYRGCQAVTKTGRTCQDWDAQSPQKHPFTSSKYPSSGLTGNFCRNPGKTTATIWCYTTDPKQRYEACVPIA